MNAPPRFGKGTGTRVSRDGPRNATRVKVMLVDDSLTVRTIFKRMVESDPAMEVAATASSGERAIAALEKSPADVVLLDLEMPGMGGIKALPKILEASPGTQVLVVSSLTADGAEATVEALSQGAADTLLKPRPGEFTQEYRSQLLRKIKALGTNEDVPEEVESTFARPAGSPTGTQPFNAPRKSVFPAPKARQRSKRPEVIAIGASTGGIHALNLMLRTLGPKCTTPILITQHLPSSFISVFARQIENASGRRTVIAEEGTEIRKSEIAIATGHSHMCVRRQAGRLIVRSSADPAPSGCLPSVDPMLTSLAEVCEGHVLGIILSGMGRDGFEGAGHVVDAGGEIWAQNAETSSVWGMPGAVAKGGLTSLVAAPEALGMAIMEQLAEKHGVTG